MKQGNESFNYSYIPSIRDLATCFTMIFSLLSSLFACEVYNISYSSPNRSGKVFINCYDFTRHDI